MFSLIITIISIALVAALALATIYYGGSAFNKGSAEARASQFINEGQQLSGAVTLNKADFAAETAAEVTTVAGLVTGGYLGQVPANWVDTTDISADTGSILSKAVVKDDVCKAVNKKAGLGDVIATDAAAVTTQYGCYAGTGADLNVVTYKF